MNDVLFSKWPRLTSKKKIPNSPVNSGRACDISSSAYNIMSHFHSWCNRRPVVLIGGAPDC